MDRDKRWDRVKKAYDALVYGQGEFTASGGAEAVGNGYERDENDEFVKPTVVVDASGAPIGRIQTGDEVVFFNFRPDRARQLSHALVDEKFSSFERDEWLKIRLTTMTHYEDGLNAAVAFTPEDINPADIRDTLGEVVANAGLRQLRIAETEKYAHVTYFFSGGQEKEFPQEKRILIPSPKVATYDLQPEMSASQVGDRLEELILSGEFDLIVANFANGDMVGHTGVMEAAKKAIETVDAQLQRVVSAVRKAGASAVITSDHGNAEEMWNYQENVASTQHSLNPSFCIVIDPRYPACALRRDGALCDVAPTVLKLMGLAQPQAMTGKPLLIVD
jgi:2,3-bisphosphoglycerate-independent phosphoglycerate mutase